MPKPLRLLAYPAYASSVLSLMALLIAGVPMQRALGYGLRQLTQESQWASGDTDYQYANDDTVATCSSGREIAAAFANSTVHTILIKQDVTLFDDDWKAYKLPIILARNLTITGPAGRAKELWPAFDANFVKDKVLLAPGVALTFTQLVIDNSRTAPNFQVPGMDMLYPKRHVEGEAPSWVLLQNVAGIQRTCLPANLSILSASTVERPAEAPGFQTTTILQPPASCINSSSPEVPRMKRCWGAYGMYVDIAGYGKEPKPTFGYLEQLSYLVWATNAEVLCPGRMTWDCIRANGGTLPCFNTMFPPTNTTANSSFRAASPPPPDPLDLAAREDVGDIGVGSSGGSSKSSSSSSLLAPLLGGLLGGLFLLGAVVTAVFAMSRKRRNVRREDDYGGSTKEGVLDGAKSVDKSEMPSYIGETAETGVYSDATSNGMLSGETAPPSPAGADQPVGPVAQPTPAELEEAALMPVTELTPPLPDVDLSIAVASEVQLTSTILGAGTYGRVIKGVYRGVPVAVKLVKKGLGAHPEQQQQHQAGAAIGDGAGQQLAGTAAATDPQSGTETYGANQALLQEVVVLARCQHPNVVRLLAASITYPDLCLVMELMDTSLGRLLHGTEGQRRQLMPLPKVLHIGIQVARALAYLHPTILHRDLKPENVLIQKPDSDTPVAKLADFGLSRLLSTVLITKNPEVGTASYMAPETFDLGNMIITDRSDIYSLGVVLYEMLAGQRPWVGLNMVQVACAVKLHHSRPALNALPPDRCPPKLRSLIVSCWEPDPRRRPAAAEVVKVLALVQQETARGTATGYGSVGP